MLHLYTFRDIANAIKRINTESWLVKVSVVVTTRHIICIDTDGEVEFFRYSVDNTKSFMLKLHLLHQAMLHFDYEGCGKLRVNLTKKYSNKLYELWNKANILKLQKLSLKQ